MDSAPGSPADIAALQRQLAELQAQLDAATRSRLAESAAGLVDIDSHGGAVVGHSVSVANGHFIGRDYIANLTRITQAGDDAEEVKSVIALYLHALVKDLSGLRLAEIHASTEQAKQSPLQLADIYVPLDTTLRIGEDQSLGNWLSSRAGPVDQGRNALRDPMRPVSALEVLAAQRELIVLGKPGSGKSTFGASVLLALAQAWQGHAEKIGKLGEHWTHGPLLPIRVVLRRFAEQLPAGARAARAGDLWAFIGRDLEDSGHGISADSMKYVQRIVRNNGALVLFDGLDECGDATRRKRVQACWSSRPIWRRSPSATGRSSNGFAMGSGRSCGATRCPQSKKGARRTHARGAQRPAAREPPLRPADSAGRMPGQCRGRRSSLWTSLKLALSARSRASASSQPAGPTQSTESACCVALIAAR